ncbi:MAG: type IX secretion system sortase PorU [Candidatus Saccharibacteria bacterium]
MRKLLLICVFLFTAFYGWSTEFNRKIVWRQPVSSDQQALKKWFEGAVLMNENSLPYWMESFALQTADATVSIADTVFEPFEGALGLLADSIGNDLRLVTTPGTSAGKTYLSVSILPLVKKGGKIFKLTAFTLSVNELPSMLKSAKAPYEWKQTSVLSTGKWTKLKVKNKGIYKITYDQLKAWGYPNPESVVLYGNGGYMLPVLNKDTKTDDLLAYPVWKGKDNTNKDCLFFYATGNIQINYNIGKASFSHQQNYYSTETYFYLSDQGTPLLIQKAAEVGTDAGRQVFTYPNYTFYEKEENNLIESGSQWFGETFSAGSSRSVTMTLDNPDATSPAIFTVSAAGRSSSSSSMDVSVNGKSLLNLPFISYSDYDYARGQIMSDTMALSTKNLQFRLTYNASNTSSIGWLDYIAVNYQSMLNMTGDVFNFRGRGVYGAISTTEFVLAGATSTTRLLNITDLFQTVEVPVNLADGKLKFKSNSSLINEYIAFNPDGAIPVPDLVGTIANQNLHGQETPEMIIVTHPSLESVAKELADFHRASDGMNVQVVTPELIYNEFSGGLPDPAGIRNYFRMFYNRTRQSGTNGLKYVLLMGDGSYDNRNLMGKNFNLLPTYQSDESLSETLSYVTDDFFVFLDENEGGSSGIIDLGIGRIPARTVEEAQAVVNKIKSYHQKESLGSWRNNLTFIADDGNIADQFSSIHMEAAEGLTILVNNKYPEFFTDKIYFDAYKKITSAGGEKYPDVTAAILDRIKRGTLILNYTGHANERNLADENVMDIGIINSLTNSKRLPIFVTATCEFSRFDADETSAGERFLLNPDGGGIGLFSTTRLVYSSGNETLNQKFFQYVFEKDTNGNNLRLGEVMRLAKAAAHTGTNQLNFTLLSDPALMLAEPENKVITTSVNGKNADMVTDTITPMSVVTIKGFVADNKGAKMTSFNGEIIPTVYDKAMIVHTLGNSHQGTMDYQVQNNIIYRGLASVTNGDFEFSFFVPKDISYKLDRGKIIYYAYNETHDANGYYDQFYIGGASNTTVTDTDGPSINLFMNSDSFKEGGQVSASSVLIARIDDQTGINTAGTGIGHDITAVLDGDYSNLMVLNDYFQTSMDKHTEGSVVFPINNLSPGKHTLTVKVWDVLNNSSEKQITFVVKDDFRIDKVECYPNPMEQQTSFTFTHNLPDQTFDVTLEVFQTNGKRVDMLQTKVGSNGIESLPLQWDPASRGIKMQAGVYIYRLTVTAQGKTGSGSGRLVYVYR